MAKWEKKEWKFIVNLEKVTQNNVKTSEIPWLMIEKSNETNGISR